MEVFNVVINVFTCIGILVALFEFYYFKKSLLSENERVRKQATIDFYKEIASDLYEMNSIIYRKYKRDLITYEEIVQDEEIRLTIKKYLNVMEWISTGINTGVYDINVFDRLYGNVTIRMYNQLKNYIINKRIEINEMEVYQDYELLVKRLKQIHIDNGRELLNEAAIIKNRIE